MTEEQKKAHAKSNCMANRAAHSRSAKATGKAKSHEKSTNQGAA